MKYAFAWTNNFTQRINFVSFREGISDIQLGAERRRKNGYATEEMKKGCAVPRIRARK